MPKKDSSRDEKKTLKIPVKDIPQYLQNQAEENKQDLQALTVDSLKDGFVLYIQETATGKATLQHIELFPEATTKSKPQDLLKEYRRLREKFAPVAAGIDYLKEQILGSGIDAGIDNLKDSTQKEIREWVREFIERVYQDTVTVSINEILEVLLDEALTVGASAAELCYENDIIFEDYVESIDEVDAGDGKKQLVYTIREPEWANDENLKHIKRMKIIDNAITRVKPHQHPKSWDIMFWTLDEKIDKPIIQGGVSVPSDKAKVNVIKYHPWEIFWLSINRRSHNPQGESVIAQVYEAAILLEKIEKAIGEGLYRAGNKKYFIICGTEKRPWGEPHIRNFMKLMKDMAKKGWGSVPVPAGFDIKEIGGEVFEGRDIVDHFVGMLAFGLGVPKDAIMMGRGRATDTASNVSSVKIARKRDGVGRAIKRQLFSRHVWCKYGKEKTKQGGKATEPTWIPPVKWLKKDFMTVKDRIDSIFKARNVANPFRPEVTLEMDREMAELMGYEVLLPTQEEFQELLKQMAKEAEEMEKKKLEKKQGEPAPQTLERQEKRQEGMKTKSEKKSRGQSKEQGGPRTPQEGRVVEESAKIDRDEVLKEQLVQKQLEALKEEIKLKKLMQVTERKKQEALESD